VGRATTTGAGRPVGAAGSTDGPAVAGAPDAGLLRRDARRNRERILDVAGELFATRGLDTSMTDIAAAAGVGVGTVYRRFPDRADLLRGVFEQRLAALEGLALEARRHPDAWEAIGWLFEQALGLESTDRGLMQLLGDETLRAALVGRVDSLRTTLRLLVARAQASGQLRADVGVADLLLLRRMLLEAASATRAVRPEYWRRMLAISLDGLAAPGAAPLPGRPLSDAELDRARDAALGPR
jgi:AcrR family transcriptional regulator